MAEEIRHNRFNKSSYQYTERRNLTGRGLVNALSISNLHPLDNLNQQHHIYVCTSMKAAPPLSFNTKFLNTWMLPCREINARRIKIYSPSHALNLFKQFFKARAFFYLSFFKPPPPFKWRAVFYNGAPALRRASILPALTDCLSAKLPLSCIPTTANSCTETFTFTATTCTLRNLCH